MLKPVRGKCHGLGALWITLVCLGLETGFAPGAVRAEEPARLVGHWLLTGDVLDRSGREQHGINKGVMFPRIAGGGRRASGVFNGQGAHVEIPLKPDTLGGTGDFSLAAWVEMTADTTDLPGSIASQFDESQRRGFSLGFATNTGVTSSQANFRQIEFGIDSARDEPGWTDHGRPGNALLIFALCAHEGALFAGTCEAGATEAGRVWKLDARNEWIDLGAPDRCNSVSALATFEGELYAGVSKYRLAGSALAESENPNKGGRVYRYRGEQQWEDCGQLPDTEAIGGMVVYGGKLYASSLYKPAGFFRYEGGTNWTACPLPNGKRVEALAVWNGGLYASSYDQAHIFRFDGQEWSDLGQVGPPENTQTYSFAVYRGELYVGTWATGRVFRYGGGTNWIDCGRLGQELEVMGMLVHNGQLYAGSLPLAEVYRYDGGNSWNRLVQLDKTADVKYRRAWTMAQYRGRLYCGTLPSGRVWSFAAGANATTDRELSPGWHHVVASRRGNRLSVHVDGKSVAESAPLAPADYDLTTDRPLRLGAGSTDFLQGRMHDVRLYRGALSAGEIETLSRE
ncbi:MAG: LamG domain-containing protein [Planctomycetaceae bacterium]